MKNWRLHRVTASLMVRVTKPMPDLTPPIEAEIDAIWRMEQSRLGNVLFNGRVFSGDVITPELVTGHWTEYRRIVAQLRRPELYEHIRIRPLAVGGVIQSPDGFIFGRRQPKAVYQAGEWQLPPAGNVDPTCEGPNGEVNVTAMLLTELGEELGLTPDQVHSPRPIAIVEHLDVHILDLGIALHTPRTGEQILTIHQASGNTEYDPIRIVPLADLATFMAQDNITGQAPLFLQTLGHLSV